MSLVIIGSGLAGYMLAKEWRKLDSTTPLTIITASDGAFYSKPLLSTALSQQKTPEQLVITTAEAMAQELDAKVITHATVTGIDPVANQLHFNQGSLAFSQLVLACGAEVMPLQLHGAELADVQSINNLGDYWRFRQWLAGKKQLAILGAGLVGCEFANDLVNAKYAVTVIAADVYPLASVLPPAVGRLLEDQLAQQGLIWRLNQLATAIERCGQQLAITLSGQQQIFVDGVIAAIGLRPQINLAKQAGIQVNRGIVVDRWHQTNFAHIFALGDCAEVDGVVRMYVAPLLQSARALAKTLTGQREAISYPVMPVVVKTPALPLVFCAPPIHIDGEWHIEGEGHHLRALCHDEAGQVRGFALTGDRIRDKLALAKQLLE